MLANHVERRFGEHVSQGPKAAKYLRGRLPLEIVYRKKIGSRSEASKEELRIKRVWTRRTLQATTWLISLGLLAASAAVTVSVALVWLVSGSEIILALGVGGGLLLGLAGVWHLLRQLDLAVKQLRDATSGVNEEGTNFESAV